MEEEEGHTTPDSTSRELKKPKRFSNYEALMKKLIDEEPSTYEEASSQ